MLWRIAFCLSTDTLLLNKYCNFQYPRSNGSRRANRANLVVALFVFSETFDYAINELVRKTKKQNGSVAKINQFVNLPPTWLFIKSHAINDEFRLKHLFTIAGNGWPFFSKRFERIVRVRWRPIGQTAVRFALPFTTSYNRLTMGHVGRKMSPFCDERSWHVRLWRLQARPCILRNQSPWALPRRVERTPRDWIGA